MKDLLKAGPLLQLGWVLAFSTLVPLGLGVLVDRHFHTAPLFILVGALVGIIAGTFGTVRTATRAIDALGKTGQNAEDSGVSHLGRGKEDGA